MAENDGVKTEVPLQNADAVARGATARAEKLEKENEKLRKQLAERAPKANSEEAAQLRGELERMKDQYADLIAKLEAASDVRAQLKKEPRALEDKFKGTKHYTSHLPHYRQGVLYPPGTVITVTNERPSKHWREVKQVVKTEYVPVAQTGEGKPETAPAAEQQKQTVPEV